MIKTPIQEIIRNYDREDPWGYKTNPADIERKRIILDVLNQYGPFETALDIGCGEGWITTDIPAKKIYGYELAPQAVERWPSNIEDYGQHKLRNKVELVLITGCLYANYKWENIVGLANIVATKYIVTSNIADRECPEAVDFIKGELIEVYHYLYHRSTDEQFTQRLRVYKK